MYYRLMKCVDGEWDVWCDYGESELHCMVEDAWKFGKMGIPVKLTAIQVKPQDKVWLWREGEEDA